MTPTARWLIVIYLALGAYCASGCAHKYQKNEHEARLHIESEKWENTAAKHEEQQQQTEQQQQRHSSGKARIVRPQETIDVEWVDDVVSKYLQVAQGASDSKSHTAGSADVLDKGERDKKVKADTKAGWPSPLWLLLLVPLAALVWWLRSRWRSVIPW